MVIIEAEGDSHLKDVLARMNIKWAPRWSYVGAATFQVSLSKYELLYLRLACKIGKITPVEYMAAEVE